jgi:Xaa-Pro aminopeptidase
MFEAKFQTFEDRAEKAALPARVKTLRAELTRRGLDGFVVPRADQHQNEYVPPSEERLAWLTGFTGSAGLAIVLTAQAALFVDGRYTVQVADQTDLDLFTPRHLIDETPETWLKTVLRPGDCLGYDPWLTTKRAAEKLEEACRAVGAFLVAADPNPVDAVWKDRPPAPLAPVLPYDPKFAGRSADDKIEAVQAALRKDGHDALVVSDPHALAWLFNIRGGDVGHTPLPLGYAIVPAEQRPTVLIDARKMGEGVKRLLAEHADLASPVALPDLVRAISTNGRSVRLDSATAAAALSRLVEDAGGKPVQGSDPIALMKAVKTPAEIAGTREAHRRDGLAVTRFLAWFAANRDKGLSEIVLVEALETFRRDGGALKDISFPTISGAGPNGALPHYRVTTASNRVLEDGEILVLDSGAQYEDGTTDITRTLVRGTPTPEMRDRVTRVLKGHIAIATAIFPEGTTGAQLDTLARQYLWAAGLDFDHGTGHGVGAYLSVHEGPQRISKLGTTPLKRGMLLSNEPGYYKAGAFGVRIENLVLVREADAIDGAERAMNAFETITLAPIETALIDKALMTAHEIAWLDAYHARVRDVLAPDLDSATRSWLVAATQPLS